MTVRIRLKNSNRIIPACVLVACVTSVFSVDIGALTALFVCAVCALMVDFYKVNV